MVPKGVVLESEDYCSALNADSSPIGVSGAVVADVIEALFTAVNYSKDAELLITD